VPGAEAAPTAALLAPALPAQPVSWARSFSRSRRRPRRRRSSRTGLPRYTAHTLNRAGDLMQALSAARLTRIATCDGELVAGDCAVATP
jgi:DNA-binding IclR family transcriptional regulator